MHRYRLYKIDIPFARRALVFVVTVLALFLINPSSADARALASQCYNFGDVDKSGAIGTFDTDKLNAYLFFGVPLGITEKYRADVNDSGPTASNPTVDVGDRDMIADYYNFLRDDFPVCYSKWNKPLFSCNPTGTAFTASRIANKKPGLQNRVALHDVLKILEYEAGLNPPFTPDEFEQADVWQHRHPAGGSRISSIDAAILLQYLEGLISNVGPCYACNTGTCSNVGDVLNGGTYTTNAECLAACLAASPIPTSPTPTPIPSGNVSITSCSITPTTVSVGGNLTISATINNGRATTITTQSPYSGFVYSEGQNFNTLGFGATSGRFRIGTDLAGLVNYPYRWGWGTSGNPNTTLAPGGSTTITGNITMTTAGTKTFQVGLVEEGIAWLQQNQCQRTVTVVTPTPTPTPGPLPAPSNLTSFCPAPGTNATVSWSAVSGATRYALRVDDTTANGWNGGCNGSQNPGDICTDFATGTSYAFSSTANHSYRWWMHSCDATTCNWGSQTNGPTFVCPASTPTPTPTPFGATPTPTPTPTSSPTYSISGKVYVDSNSNGVQEGRNGVQDPSERLCTPSITKSQREACMDSGARCIGGDEGTGPCWYDVYQEQGYRGAAVRRSGSSTPATTSNTGVYRFLNLLPGSYTIALTVPAGYTATTSNPVITSVGPNKTVNFGIISGIQCSDGIDNDGDGLIDAADPGCHTDGNPFNQPSYNPNGTLEAAVAPTPTPTPVVISGAVVIDSAGDNCASGTTPYTGAATVATYNSGGSETGNVTADGSGSYLISDSTTPGQKTAVISNIAGYQVRQVRFDNGAWTTSSLSGYTYGPFNFSANHALDWCINNVSPWFQTTTGDVRMNSLLNKVPSGVFASADPTNPSVFYSSSFPSNFGSGRSSAKGWTVNDEYAYQDDFKNRNGTMSYSFYVSRIAQQNVTTNNIPGCSGGGNCTAGISNLSTGAYNLNNGNLTINSYSHQAAARVLLLVNGDVTIRSNISVPAGSLLVIAAKGSITIDRSVGTTNISSTAPQISGVLTAEESIIADGGKCQGNTPDRRLNIGGSLIANSLKPFQVGSSGALVNNRSLCQQDVNYPSIYVSSRYDFVTQLTDFYKTAYTRWREAAP